MRTILGAGWRLVLILATILAIAIAPLFLVYRSKCVEDGERVDSWSLVAPWDDPPEDCGGHQHGFDVLRDEVGL